MAQHDYDIANQSFPAFRTDVNNVLSAINSSNSGSSRPSSAVAGTIWLDTSGAATAQLLKMYDGAADILLGTVNFTANTIDWSDSAITLGANSVDSDNYVDGSIDTDHIANDQITLAKMASGTDGNLISYDASGNPVAVATGSAAQVLTSAGAGSPPTFATATVPDNAITLAKMASGTDGNIISYDTSGNPVAVATGSDGQVLTSAGAGAVPSFQTAAGGGTFEVVATADYSSGVSSFTISDCFTSAYSVYKVFGHNIQGANNQRVFIQVLDSGGSVIGNWTHTSNLSYVSDSGAGGGETQYHYGGVNYYKFQDYEFHDSATNTMGSMEHTFYQPYESSHTQITGPSIIHADNGNIYASWISGHLFSTTSNRSLKFYTQSGGNFAAYKITVLGMKRS
jgi:hypothetical protein